MMQIVWVVIIFIVLFGISAHVLGFEFSFWKVLLVASAVAAAVVVAAKLVEGVASS
jgi:hypothetical protein